MFVGVSMWISHVCLIRVCDSSSWLPPFESDLLMRLMFVGASVCLKIWLKRVVSVFTWAFGVLCFVCFVCVCLCCVCVFCVCEVGCVIFRFTSKNSDLHVSLFFVFFMFSFFSIRHFCDFHCPSCFMIVSCFFHDCSSSFVW